MSTLVSQGRVVADAWTLASVPGDLPERGDVIVPLSLWPTLRDRAVARDGRVGVLLELGDDASDLAADLPSLALIAIDFPHFTDGRGYSTARLLRERYAFAGELRAVGDVGRDQVFYLSRVGFDAFALREGEDADAALGAFADFSEAYQASIDRPLPLFRRRAPVAGPPETDHSHEGAEA